jgi:hypothetical protein
VTSLLGGVGVAGLLEVVAEDAGPDDGGHQPGGQGAGHQHKGLGDQEPSGEPRPGTDRVRQEWGAGHCPVPIR